MPQKVGCQLGGPLTVCTTGDYPPLTSRDNQGMVSGLDPILIRKFAAINNYAVEFVPTTWPTLSADLASGSKCLLAVGGISRTPARAQEFVLSEGFLADRKVPIFSKTSAERFASSEDLDKPGVTLLENKGGTNMAFVEKLRRNGILTRAEMQILPANEEVYACLDQYPDKPLVMFTDLAEVEYRVAKPGSVLSDAGTRFDIPLDPELHKVFLAQNTSAGRAITAEVDAFLAAAKSDGRFQRWKQEAFSADYQSTRASCPLSVS